eukprot:m.195837 g.195837  ORF g.195837 m.195837 type:complete len:74 (+) comp32588_c0_seq3:1135-1356(+)
MRKNRRWLGVVDDMAISVSSISNQFSLTPSLLSYTPRTQAHVLLLTIAGCRMSDVSPTEEKALDLNQSFGRPI